MKNKHILTCKCGKLAIECKEASKALIFIVDTAKKEVFDDVEEWLSEDGVGDWRAWDSDYLDRYDKMKEEHLNTNNTENKKEVQDE